LFERLLVVIKQISSISWGFRVNGKLHCSKTGAEKDLLSTCCNHIMLPSVSPLFFLKFIVTRASGTGSLQWISSISCVFQVKLDCSKTGAGGNLC